MFKGLTKMEIISVIGTALLGAVASTLLNVATIKANKEEIRELVHKEMTDENEE